MRNVLMRRPIPYTILLRVHIFYGLVWYTWFYTILGMYSCASNTIYLFQRTGENDDEIIKLMIKRFIIFII